MHINPNTSNNAPQTHEQNQTNKEKSKTVTAVTVQQLPWNSTEHKVLGKYNI